MAHGYRKLQHWDHWLAQHYLGSSLMAEEKKTFSRLLARQFGKHVLLIGVPQQINLLSTTSIPCHTLLSPLLPADKKNHCYVEGDFHELPILTGSIDVVLLPHTLEFIDNPRQLLAEACRIVKPEGLILISGFHPYGPWGLKKMWQKKFHNHWSGNFISANHIKNWLQLADFAMEKQESLLFRPPINHRSFYERLHFLESVAKFLPALSGEYVLLARAKVVPLTPIKLKWKQQLSGIRISTTISGHIARQSK